MQIALRLRTPKSVREQAVVPRMSGIVVVATVAVLWGVTIRMLDVRGRSSEVRHQRLAVIASAPYL